MICDLPGRHFSLRMSPRSSLRRVRPGPGLGHRGRVASRERFSERLVEVCILFGLLLRLGLGFLGHGNSSGSPFHNQPEIAVSGLSHSSHCVRTQHFAIGDRRRRPPETGIMKGAAQKK
jgi:hypothetical protein